MNPYEMVMGMIAERETQEAFSRAIGWGVLVTHADEPAVVLGLYGGFTEPAAALAHASGQEAELNQEGEEGFRCHVHPIMPVT